MFLLSIINSTCIHNRKINTNNIISKHDINKAHSLLNAPQLSKLASYQFAIREMLDMNVKCDLEAFFMINYNRLSNFVENALLSNDSL